MEAVEDLLLNYLLLLFCICYLPFLFEKRNPYVIRKGYFYTIGSVTAVILCIFFPVEWMGMYTLDLRLIAVVIGGLYGGFRTSVILFSISIIFHFLFRESGLLPTIIILTAHILFTAFLTDKYQQFFVKRKLIASVMIGFASAVVYISVIWLLYRDPIDVYILFGFSMVQALGLFSVVYTIESIRENSFMREQAMLSDKLKMASYLSSSISHEVRNPITAVRGFLQLLRRPLTEDKRNEYLKIAVSELDRAEGIIHDYLNFTKPASTDKDKLCISEELDRVIEIIRPLANMNNVNIISDINKSWINCNRQQFRQCIMNITKNSIEAMQDGGILKINSKVMGGRVFITITDTGIGMSKDELHRLGEPYFSTKGENGTGLGMLVVYQIIESVQGTIEVDSKPGCGTEFMISFPIVQINVNKENNRREGKTVVS